MQYRKNGGGGSFNRDLCNFQFTVTTSFRAFPVFGSGQELRELRLKQTRWLPSEQAKAERPVIYEMIIKAGLGGAVTPSYVCYHS